MNLQSQHIDGVLVVRPVGLIDHIAAAGFEAALAPHLRHCTSNGQALVLDLQDLEYISSAGLRVLMMAAKQVKAQGGRIALATPQPVVKEILEISRFNLVFDLLPSVAAALERLRNSKQAPEVP